MKVTKEITTRLIKYVTKVDIAFNPFDARSKPAKEMLRQMQSDRFSLSNSKLKVTPSVVATANPPVIEFNFVDGSKLNFDCEAQHCKEMLDEVWQHADDIEFQYEMENKNIEDV